MTVYSIPQNTFVVISESDVFGVVVLQECQSFPESYPELPKQDTVESSLLQKHILELATMLDVQSLFWDDPLEAY